jgi:hypothetical protein
MNKREVVVVGVVDLEAALRRLFEAPLGERPEAGGAPQLLDAILVLEQGRAESVVVSDGAVSVTLKERNLARAQGDTCYVRVSTDWLGEAEAFEAEGSLGDALANAALSVYYRFLPSGPNRTWRRPWLGRSPRCAVVVHGDEALFYVSEISEPRALPETTFGVRSLKLVPIAADTVEELESLQMEIAARARKAEPFPSIARAALRIPGQGRPGRLGLALLAKCSDQLLQEIELARKGLRRSTATGEEWRTPAGSCSTANPLSGDVAFVYLGVASPYEGVGADLFAVAPQLIDEFGRITQNQAARYLHTDDIYPRHPGDRTAFYRDVVALGECAISVSSILTLILRGVLGV